MNNELDKKINEAKNIGSYFVTITTKDKNKTENDLKHHVVQSDFAFDDIVPSLDAAIHSMGIRPEKPVDVIKPEKPKKDKKPLKIAIISHFNRAPESYSPARAVKNQVKILR